MDRREFLKKSGLSLLAVGLAGPLGLLDWKGVPLVFAADKDDNILIVIQLSGGNDGLNTLVPFKNGLYFDNRPTIGMKESEIIALNNEVGFPNTMKNFKNLYDKGKVAVIQGVGYPNPNLSHFRSQDIWQTGVPDKEALDTGWLGRYMDLVDDKNQLKGVTIGSPSRILLSRKYDSPTIDDINRFKLSISAQQYERDRRLRRFRNMYQQAGLDSMHLVIDKGNAALKASDKVQGKVKPSTFAEYPQHGFSNYLKLLTGFIVSGLNTNVYFTQFGGFDEHANEKNTHAKLFQTFDQCIGAFYHDLEQLKLADRVTIMVYSEFGRRVKENASGGTDHGTAAPVFVLGGKVKGGLYGEYPSLDRLDNGGNLKHTVDFRSVYATLLDNWLKVPSRDILYNSFENLNFV